MIQILAIIGLVILALFLISACESYDTVGWRIYNKERTSPIDDNDRTAPIIPKYEV